MQWYQFSPEVTLMLVNHSDETEWIVYDHNSDPWQMPKIGPRPPYYTNPRYEQYYPII